MAEARISLDSNETSRTSSAETCAYDSIERLPTPTIKWSIAKVSGAYRRIRGMRRLSRASPTVRSLASPESVRNGPLGHCKNWHEPVCVPDVEQHAVRCLACHALRFEIPDEER